MITILRPLAVFAAATIAIVSYPTFAHHSMSEFDRSVVEEIEGTMSRVSWKNPHVLFEVTTDDGAVYLLEGSAVSSQRRRGLTGDEISVGDTVRIAGWPSTRRDNYIQVSHVLVERTGLEMLVGGAREPRWADESMGGNREYLAETSPPDTTVDGIFRVWSQGSSAWFFTGRSHYQLTPMAQAAVDNWDDIEDNPIIECIAPGMPALMGNPYPMEFVQAGDNIEIRFEEFDALRVIHMGDNIAGPETQPLSHWGYSVGRWEGDTLVVDTSRVGWHYFDRTGAPQTPAVRINERFTVIEDGNRLNWTLTVNEPDTLVEPFVLDGYFIWKPGEQVGRYECELEGWASSEATL